MANNDQIILDQIIDEQRNSRLPNASKSDFFELYVSEQVLKDYDLSDEEIEYGLTRGSQDGGMDGIYIFVNGELVREDFDHSGLKKNIVIDVVIFQSKTSDSFDEDTLNKFIASTGHLFSLADSLDIFKQVYNEKVIEAVSSFRNLYRGVVARFPSLRFSYYYVSRGDSKNVHQNVVRKTQDLQKVVSGHFPDADYKFLFYGANDLLELARRQPTTSFQMKFSESLTGQDGYILLVRLKDFIDFIRIENGQLRKNLFEANVRDYQGNNQVNEEMQQTLIGDGSEEFWWLNNGVTIVASKAVQGGKILTIEDPQIVNGQQTSTEIYNYFQKADTSNDERSVMVRVIVTNDSITRDRIIKATNSQTQIPAASLRATEKIHRDIEEFLAPFSLYYDRRKNSQKQLGRPTDKIVSIAFLAQAMMSIVLQRPDDARARPSSLIKKEEDYNKIFNPTFPIRVYLIAALIAKKAQTLLRTREDFSSSDKTNILFYVTMHSACLLIGLAKPNAQQISEIQPEKITSEIISNSIDCVVKIYRRMGANDQIAKGPTMLVELKNELSHVFSIPIV